MTADARSRCGWENRDLRGSAVFRCESCGLTMDRQPNAAIDLYLRMEGVPISASGGTETSSRRWWAGTS